MESVWDYPRPPRVERSGKRVRIVHAGETVVDSDRCWRVLETSHPPVYYVPRGDVGGRLRAAAGSSFCEYKGTASYWDLVAGDRTVANAAWSYEHPTADYAGLTGAIAFYPGRVDECTVDGERVVAQDGDFYGGWITGDIAGPFKGGAGTAGW